MGNPMCGDGHAVALRSFVGEQVRHLRDLVAFHLVFDSRIRGRRKQFAEH